jgi:AGCS family alanine or glycine:cation symporter
MLSEGVGRGIFSNEAGLGSAAIAHAQADVDHPVRQGMWGIIEVFLVTFIISTLTALVVLTSGEYIKAWPDSFELALASFSGFPLGDKLFAISLILFSFTTLLTWSFYGEEGIADCLGDWMRVPFRVIYGVTALLGAVGSAGLFLDMAGIFDGVTVLLNLAALAILGFAIVPRLVIGFLRGEAWHRPVQAPRTRTRR